MYLTFHGGNLPPYKKFQKINRPQLQFLYGNKASNIKDAFKPWYPFILIVRMFHMNDYLNNSNQENGFLIEIKFA